MITTCLRYVCYLLLTNDRFTLESFDLKPRHYIHNLIAMFTNYDAEFGISHLTDQLRSASHFMSKLVRALIRSMSEHMSTLAYVPRTYIECARSASLVE